MLVGSAVRRVAIIGGVRIPFARAHGAYAKASNQDMLTAAFRGVVDRFNLGGVRLGDVAAGAVIKHTKDYNLTRESLLSAGLHPQTPGVDLQRACGTSLEAAILIGNKIALGQIDSGIAGGFDTTSDAPIAINEDLRQVLLEINRSGSNAARLKALAKIRPPVAPNGWPAASDPPWVLSLSTSISPSGPSSPSRSRQ